MKAPQRTVRFYEPEVLDQQNQHQPISANFWHELFGHLSTLTAADRENSHEGVRLYGQVGQCPSPAAQYLYVGRVRSQDRFPDHYRRGQGTSGRLQPGQQGDELAEPTYVVPFGGRNLVAVLAPVSAPVRATGLARWLNNVLGMVQTDERLQLKPVMSPSLEHDLEHAVGATSTRVKLMPNASAPSGLGQVGRAIESARSAVDTDAFVEIGFSFGTRGAGSSDGRDNVLTLARAVVEDPAAIASATAKLEVLDEDGNTRIATHNLIEDIAGEKVRFALDGNAEQNESRIIFAALAAAEAYEASRRRTADGQ